MKYFSTVINRLNYYIDSSHLVVERDGDIRTYNAKQFDKMMEETKEQSVKDELKHLIEVHMIIYKNEGVLSLDLKAKVAKILGITYGELETKIQHGQLEL